MLLLLAKKKSLEQQLEQELQDSFGHAILHDTGQKDNCERIMTLDEWEAILPYTISHTEDAGYFTTVVTLSGEKKRIKSRNLDVFLKKLEDFYAGRQTVGDTVEAWLNMRASQNDNYNTVRRLRVDWQTFFLRRKDSASLVNLPLRDLNALKVQIWAERLLQDCPMGRKKFNRILSPLKQALDYSVIHDDVLTHNPVRDIVLKTTLFESPKSKDFLEDVY